MSDPDFVLRRPPPLLPAIIPFDDGKDIQGLLSTFWRVAGQDHGAFAAVKRILLADSVQGVDQLDDDSAHGLHDLNNALLRHIRQCQPLHLRHLNAPMDAFTLEVLEGIWVIACNYPTPGQFSALGDSICVSNGYLARHLVALKENELHRTRSTDVSPITDLPVELLTMIFLYLRFATPTYPTNARGNDIWDIASHLPARAVCKHWHDVVDSIRSMWARMVHGFGRELSALAITRSGNYPLDIRMAAPAALDRRTSLVLAQLSRVRTLIIDVNPASSATSEHILALLTKENAPNLEVIGFIPPAAHDAGTLIDAGTLVFPGGLSLTPPPSRLRTVRLGNCKIPAGCGIFLAALVELSLSGCDTWYSVHGMLDTLTLLPLLQNFEWEISRNELDRHRDPVTRIAGPAFVTSTHQPRSVRLPALKCLSLRAPMACVEAIMSRLHIPKSCSVTEIDEYTLTGASTDGGVGGVIECLRGSIGAHVGRQFPPESGKGYATVRIAEPHAGALMIAAFGRDASNTAEFTIIVSGNSIARRRALDGQTTYRLLEEVMGWSVMKPAPVLLVEHSNFKSFREWGLVLEKLTSVRCIAVANSIKADIVGPMIWTLNSFTGTITVASALATILFEVHPLDWRLREDLLRMIQFRRQRGHAISVRVKEPGRLHLCLEE